MSADGKMSPDDLEDLHVSMLAENVLSWNDGEKLFAHIQALEAELAAKDGSIGVESERLRCIIANIRNIAATRFRKAENWVLVMNAFGVGSTVAADLCHHAGLDPWSRLSHRPPEPRPITAEDIKARSTPRGGYRAATLAEWGVPWPPPIGWKEALIQHGIPYKPRNKS